MNPRTIVMGIIVLAASALAQDRGSVSGTVTDSSGGAVPLARVTLTSPATGITLNFVTGAEGGYTFASLPAGRYTITVEKTGFRKAELMNVAVAVDTNSHADIKLELGQVQETVQVQTSVSQLQTDRSDLGVIIDKQAVADLPLFVSGGMRSNLAFAELAPGVRTDLSQDVDEGALR